MSLRFMRKAVLQSYATPQLCSLQLSDRYGEVPQKYGEGTLEVRFHEWGRPYPSSVMLLRPNRTGGVLSIWSKDVLAKMQEERRYPHLRQINQVTDNRYDLILTCYQWTDAQIEALRHCHPMSTREVPCIDYTLTINVDRAGLAIIDNC